MSGSSPRARCVWRHRKRRRHRNNYWARSSSRSSQLFLLAENARRITFRTVVLYSRILHYVISLYAKEAEQWKNNIILVVKCFERWLTETRFIFESLVKVIYHYWPLLCFLLRLIVIVIIIDKHRPNYLLTLVNQWGVNPILLICLFFIKSLYEKTKYIKNINKIPRHLLFRL